MKHRLPLPRIALGLWLAVVSQSGAAADDPSGGALPPTLVTPAVLGAKITETEADPDLQAEAKTKLVALYREAVSNL
jgi:potassium efflux system protein